MLSNISVLFSEIIKYRDALIDIVMLQSGYREHLPRGQSDSMQCFEYTYILRQSERALMEQLPMEMIQLRLVVP